MRDSVNRERDVTPDSGCKKKPRLSNGVLVEDRKLRVEVIPGKTATRVAGFSELAKFYER